MPANYVLLERIELNASAASVTFSNIPQSGYTDLKIVMSARCTNASTVNVPRMTFNGTTSGYSGRYVEGDGSGTSSNLAATDGFSLVGVTAANATANTFGNLEVYIPNYTSNQYKSASSDQVTENNATQAFTDLQGYLWSNTAAITSITITPNSSASFVQYSTFSLYGLAAVGTTPVIAPKASGGNITTDGTYWIHTFNTTGAFVPQVGLTCDYLVVAGGGAGGANGGGGGGAGGLRSTVTATGGGGSLESPLSVSAQSYTITIGAGGSGSSSTPSAANGSNSIFSSITSTGGGGGGGAQTGQANINKGGNGGSGGGNRENFGTGGSGTANQGYAGGDTANVYPYPSGGGGGAGAIGQAAPSSNAGNGGNGVATSISGSSVTYGGGGGGGVFVNGGGSNGTGGTGGGGAGGSSPVAGTVNTGGGAGGFSGNSGNGANGGSGIVIIRYPIA